MRRVASKSTIALALGCTLAVAACTDRDPLTAPDVRPAVVGVIKQPTLTVDRYALVEAGNGFTCGMKQSGSADCWGLSPQGGSTDSYGSTANQGAHLLVDFAQVTVGDDHACGIDKLGYGWCWGLNTKGQLGVGVTIAGSNEPAGVGSTLWKAISAGYQHSCGIDVNGAAWCWGYNLFGQLGNGTSGGVSYAPVQVAGGHVFESISAGGHHTCAITTGKLAYCWGAAGSGQLGSTPLPAKNCINYTAECALAPKQVSTMQFSTISAGGNHTCGLTTGGTAYCWGSNEYGKLGDGNFTSTPTSTNRTTPLAVAGGLTFTSVSAGLSHTCGVTTGGAGYCWGSNYSAQLGYGGHGGSTYSYRREPTLVAGGITFATINAGSSHSCGTSVAPYLLADNAIYCWGPNSNGQLGDGTWDARPTPVMALGW